MKQCGRASTSKINSKMVGKQFLAKIKNLTDSKTEIKPNYPLFVASGGGCDECYFVIIALMLCQGLYLNKSPLSF